MIEAVQINIVAETKEKVRQILEAITLDAAITVTDSGQSIWRGSEGWYGIKQLAIATSEEKPE